LWSQKHEKRQYPFDNLCFCDSQILSIVILQFEEHPVDDFACKNWSMIDSTYDLSKLNDSHNSIEKMIIAISTPHG